MTAYLAKMRMRRRKRFPLVLMLEPLHACNLRCSGCGRIREYADTLRHMMPVDECLNAIEECGAPIVSICGGEPLIYPEIEELVAKTLERKKHIYLCTNGLLLSEKLSLFKPSSRFYWNVHLDGMAATHDLIVQKDGVFERAVEGIKAAKQAGFYVYTNTTVYQQTAVEELGGLCRELSRYKVDGFMVSPAYGYEAVCEDSASSGEEIFMDRDATVAKFREASEVLKPYRLTATPIYMDFLRGERDLPCAAWANPTRNVRGWKGPCYLVTDAHYDTYAELVEKTDWDSLGPGGDPRCEHCMVHCGFEPAAVLFGNRIRDMVRMAVWQMT